MYVWYLLYGVINGFLLIDQASFPLKYLDMHTIPTHATLIFTSEVLHLITYIHTGILNGKVKVMAYTAIANFYCYDFYSANQC